MEDPHCPLYFTGWNPGPWAKVRLQDFLESADLEDSGFTFLQSCHHQLAGWWGMFFLNRHRIRTRQTEEAPGTQFRSCLCRKRKLRSKSLSARPWRGTSDRVGVCCSGPEKVKENPDSLCFSSMQTRLFLAALSWTRVSFVNTSRTYTLPHKKLKRSGK